MLTKKERKILAALYIQEAVQRVKKAAPQYADSIEYSRISKAGMIMIRIKEREFPVDPETLMIIANTGIEALRGVTVGGQGETTAPERVITQQDEEWLRKEFSTSKWKQERLKCDPVLRISEDRKSAYVTANTHPECTRFCVNDATYAINKKGFQRSTAQQKLLVPTVNLRLSDEDVEERVRKETEKILCECNIKPSKLEALSDPAILEAAGGRKAACLLALADPRVLEVRFDSHTGKAKVRLAQGHCCTYDVFTDTVQITIPKKETRQTAFAAVKHAAKIREIAAYAEKTAGQLEHFGKVSFTYKMQDQDHVRIGIISNAHNETRYLNVDLKASYKRALHAEMKSLDTEIAAAEKKEQEEIMTLPFFGQVLPAAIAEVVSRNNRYITTNTLPALLRGLSMDILNILTRTDYDRHFSLISSEEIVRTANDMVEGGLLVSTRGEGKHGTYHGYSCSPLTRRFAAASNRERMNERGTTELAFPARIKAAYAGKESEVSKERRLSDLVFLTEHPACWCMDEKACLLIFQGLPAEGMRYLDTLLKFETGSPKKRYIKKLREAARA